MISYTTLVYYTDKYLMGRTAVIGTAVFPYYALKATLVIKKYTGSNVDEAAELPDVLQMCCCELAEYIYTSEQSKHTEGISSEKVGEYSVSYVEGTSLEDIKQSAIKGIIYTWLADTGLLYRGGL